MNPKVDTLELGEIIIEKKVNQIDLPETKGKYSPKKIDELNFKILLINGPNLNMLGKRNKDTYGSFTINDVENLASKKAQERGYKLDCFQSNHEGKIIDKIHESLDRIDGIVINPGAFTHYSYAIRDALEICPFPIIEAHISDISKREEFRKISVIAPVCDMQVKGLGIQSYSKAIDELCDIIESFTIKPRKKDI